MRAALERLGCEPTRSFGLYEYAVFGRLTALLHDSLSIEVSVRDLAVHLWQRGDPDTLDRVALSLRRLHRRGVVEARIDDDGVAHVVFPRAERRMTRNPTR
jgi:hypothetical protein